MKIVYRAESLYQDKKVIIGYFEKEEDAIKAAKKQGKTPDQDGLLLKIPVFESFEEFRETRISKIQQRAQAKLTEEEIVVLKKLWKQEFANDLSVEPSEEREENV